MAFHLDSLTSRDKTYQNKDNQKDASIPILNSLVEKDLTQIVECPAADFASLIVRVKSNLSSKDYVLLLQQRQALLKILSLCPQAILDFSTVDNYSMLGQPYIYECACSDFARDKNTFRGELEEKLLKSIEKHFNSVDELNIMSLGAGGCFQELVIHAKITALFKKKVNWILVDPILSSEKDKTLKEFKNLVKILSEYSTVYHIKDDEEAINQLQTRACPQPNIFLNVDNRLSKILTIRKGNFSLVQSKLKFFQDAVSDLNLPYVFAVLEDQNPQVEGHLGGTVRCP